MVRAKIRVEHELWVSVSGLCRNRVRVGVRCWIRVRDRVRARVRVQTMKGIGLGGLGHQGGVHKGWHNHVVLLVMLPPRLTQAKSRVKCTRARAPKAVQDPLTPLGSSPAPARAI